MPKKIFLLLLVFSLVLSGCRKDAPKTATILDLWVTSQENADTYQALADQWNQEYPEQPLALNISVYSAQRISSKLSQVLSTGSNYNSDGTPDLVELDFSAFAEYIWQRPTGLYPLQNMLLQNGCQGPSVTLYTKNDICFGLPYQGQQLVFCYRLDLEKQIPDFCENANSFETLLEVGKSYAQVKSEPLLWVDYLGNETFLALYIQALCGNNSAESAYSASVTYLQEAQAAGVTGYLPTGDAYADAFPGLMSRKEVPCLITTCANLLHLSQLDPDIPQNYGILPLPSFCGQTCQVTAPAAAISILTSGGDPILSRDFLEYCHFSEASRAYPLFYLDAEDPLLCNLSDCYPMQRELDALSLPPQITAEEIAPYLSEYSRQVLGAGIS